MILLSADTDHPDPALGLDYNWLVVRADALIDLTLTLECGPGSRSRKVFNKPHGVYEL